MGRTEHPADSVMNLMLALLTDPQQKAVLAYIGKNGLQRDDDIFVLLSLLQIGSVLVTRVADSVRQQTEFQGDLAEMLTAHRSRLLHDLENERTALLDRWGDVLGIERSIQRLFDSHRVSLKQQVDIVGALSRTLNGQIKVLQPLLDLLRPGDPDQAVTPTHFVLDAITSAVTEALERVRDEQRARRCGLALTVGYRVIVMCSIAVLLYRG